MPLNQQLPKTGKICLRQVQCLLISPAFLYTSATRQVMAISKLSLALSRGRAQCGISHCSSWPFMHIFSWVTTEELSLLSKELCLILPARGVIPHMPKGQSHHGLQRDQHRSELSSCGFPTTAQIILIK